MPSSCIKEALKLRIKLSHATIINQVLPNMSEKFQILCLYIALSLSFCMSQEQGYSRCNEGKDSCRDCYAELVRAVLGNDSNIFSLNKAFFPPRTNPAEFVAVTYHFQNESMDEPFVWFWTEQSSYLLHPLHTFQFLSLFFGKPEAFYTQKADVTLNATDCWGVDDAHLELLTQRLKAYVQRQKIFPSIDNTYSAKAVNSNKLNEILQSQGKRITAIIVSLPFVMIVIILFILLIVMCVSIHSRKWPKMLNNLAKFSTYLKQKQAGIIGVAIISFLAVAYIIALDSAALGYRENPPKSIINRIHHRNGVGNHFTLLYEIPTIVMVLDCVFGMLSICLISLSSVLFYCNYKKIIFFDENCCNPFFFLSMSSLGFVFCIVTHLPFIAIAYLNDAFHAGSIFIYYTIVSLVLFALIEQMIVSCLSISMSKLTPNGEIQLQDSEWHFKSGKLHILAANYSQQEHQSGPNSEILPMELTLDTEEENDNCIRVSQGKVGVHVLSRSIDSEIVLQIREGTLKFKGCKTVMEESTEDNAAETTNPSQTLTSNEQENLITFLKHCRESQQGKSLILRDNVLPMAYVKIKCKSNGKEETKWLTIGGLKPAEGQELKLGDINPDTKTVKIIKSKLILQKIDEYSHKICCKSFCRAPCKTFCYTMFKFGTNWGGCFVLLLGLLIFFILGIVAVLTCYFVIIPINRSISDAPNRLIGIYESAIVLVGAYIAYKAFFKAKKYLESSVVKRENPLTDPLSKESKDKWKDMSDEEKLTQFYSAVVDIIVDKKSKCQA